MGKGKEKGNVKISAQMLNQNEDIYFGGGNGGDDPRKPNDPNKNKKDGMFAGLLEVLSKFKKNKKKLKNIDNNGNTLNEAKIAEEHPNFNLGLNNIIPQQPQSNQNNQNIQNNQPQDEQNNQQQDIQNALQNQVINLNQNVNALNVAQANMHNFITVLSQNLHMFYNNVNAENNINNGMIMNILFNQQMQLNNMQNAINNMNQNQNQNQNQGRDLNQ